MDVLALQQLLLAVADGLKLGSWDPHHVQRDTYCKPCMGNLFCTAVLLVAGNSGGWTPLY